METLKISEEINVKYIEERAKNISNYSDKLRKSMMDIDTAFTPALEQAGTQFIDSEDIHSYQDMHGKISFRLKIVKVGDNWGIFVRKDVPWETEFTHLSFDSVQRIVLKNAAKRILIFLQAYGKYLSEVEREYQEISDKTEKMALSII